MKPDEIESMHPKAWEYLKTHEETLRGRENGKMDRDDWYGYVYPKNLDKHDMPKLCVGQTVPGMRVCYDSEGAFYFNNVRVNGIIPTDIETGWFLLGVLNAPLCDYIFKRIAKPKAGGYYEANKQFIAPLPIPKASDDDKAKVGEKAKHLQDLHTKRRDLQLAIDKRINSPQCSDDKRNEKWLWDDVETVATIKKTAPPELKGKALTAWAKLQRELKLTAYFDRINAMLQPGVCLTVENDMGELRVLANGAALIEGIFVDDDEASFIAAQWRHKARQTNVTEKFDAKRLLGLLLKLRKTDNDAICKQVVKIDADIQTLDEQIAHAEADMNALTYKLYGLTNAEVRLVEEG